ncbi:MAG: tRNA modification GTPase [Myxococcaceae bacterium]|nr:tRNA modification GTPase [Myxococcaceae bacterium]
MEHATIVAVATPAGRGAIGVVRVSGPRALEVLRHLAPSARPRDRRAHLTSLELDGQVVDEALVLSFPAPASFTGEHVVELQTHGAPELLRLLLQGALSVPGVRLAEPGEFTRRALANGRVDLTRAEGIIDLIEAQSPEQVRSAAARLTGQLQAVLTRLYQPLLSLSAALEAALDFPDESEGVEADAGEPLATCLAQARALEGQAAVGSRLNRAFLVVLYGPVNAGKSTLFNRLLGEARALVDNEPGTTRDAVEGVLQLGGRLVSLVDTAGLRAAPGRVEAMGIERTRELLQRADVAVLLLPPDAGPDELEGWRREVEHERRLDVQGKSDLGPRSAGVQLAVSGLDGAGVDELRAALERWLEPLPTDAGLATERHLDDLRTARVALERASTALGTEPLEVVAGEVSTALGAVGALLGLDTSTARLDALFSRFCIGK